MLNELEPTGMHVSSIVGTANITDRVPYLIDHESSKYCVRNERWLSRKKCHSDFGD